MFDYFCCMIRLIKADRRAVTALEYGLLACLIGVALAGALTTFKGSLSTAFTNMGSAL